MAYRRPESLAYAHALDSFDCGDAALDEWLQRHARQANASRSVRVFVSTESTKNVVGYYVLAAASVRPSDATARALKGQARNQPVPAILLARLAVDIRHQHMGLGASLLQDAMLRISIASDEVGVRVMLVHAKHEDAKRWYLRWGFEESPTDPLHLMLLLKDLRAFLAR